jgi:hypothetical protein
MILPSLPASGERTVLVRVRREPDCGSLTRENSDGLGVGMLVDELRLGLHGLGLRSRYDAWRARGNVRSGEGERGVPTSHSAVWAPGCAYSWPDRVLPGAGAVVHGIGALGHCAYWRDTGCRGRGGRDVNCTEAVLKRANVDDRETVGRWGGGVVAGVGIVIAKDLEGKPTVDEMVIPGFLQFKGEDLCESGGKLVSTGGLYSGGEMVSGT